MLMICAGVVASTPSGQGCPALATGGPRADLGDGSGSDVAGFLPSASILTMWAMRTASSSIS